MDRNPIETPLKAVVLTPFLQTWREFCRQKGISSHSPDFRIVTPGMYKSVLGMSVNDVIVLGPDLEALPVYDAVERSFVKGTNAERMWIEYNIAMNEMPLHRRRGADMVWKEGV